MRKIMTVKDLKEALKDQPDDKLVGTSESVDNQYSKTVEVVGVLADYPDGFFRLSVTDTDQCAVGS